MNTNTKAFRFIKFSYSFYIIFKQYFKFYLLGFIKGWIFFLNDFFHLKKENIHNNFRLSFSDLEPCFLDKTSNTPLDPTYFLQDTWAAKKIFEKKPYRHYDIGSRAMTMALIAQSIPVTMIDIRPVAIPVYGLDFIQGTILELPFADNTLNSISSLCVVEHIGLGRYGDPIDALGSEKAIKELIRILKPGGNLYFSVPVDKESIVYFNAHRAFSNDYVLKLCAELHLVEAKFRYGIELFEAYHAEKGFGTGLYHFTKN